MKSTRYQDNKINAMRYMIFERIPKSSLTVLLNLSWKLETHY